MSHPRLNTTAWSLALCLAAAFCQPAAGGTLDVTSAACFTAARPVRDVAVDAQGQIHAATWGGLVVYAPDGTPLRKYTRADGWPTHTLTAACATPDGGVWAASTRGVIRAGIPPRLYTTREGLNDRLALDLAYSERLGLLAATARGVIRLVKDYFVPLDDEHELARRRTRNIHVDEQGGVWLAKEAGLSHYAPDGLLTTFRREWLQYPADNAPARNDLTCVATDAQGRPWTGSRRGLSWFDGQRWHTLISERGLDSGTPRPLDDFMVSLAFDASGRLWMAHGSARSDGVSIWDGTNWSAYSGSDGLPSGSVYRVRSLGASLWLAMDRGLCRWEEGRFELLPSQDELTDNSVQGLEADGDKIIIRGATGTTHIEEGRAVLVFGAEAPRPSAPFTLDMEGSHPGEAGWEPTCAVAGGGQDVWVGTRHHGVWLRGSEGWREVLLHGQRLPAGITALLWRPPNVLWVGTSTEGALRLDMPEGGGYDATP